MNDVNSITSFACDSFLTQQKVLFVYPILPDCSTQSVDGVGGQLNTTPGFGISQLTPIFPGLHDLTDLYNVDYSALHR